MSALEVMWILWGPAGVPTGKSKTHLMADRNSALTLCGIRLHDNRDYEYGDGGGGYCRKCERALDQEVTP